MIEPAEQAQPERLQHRTHDLPQQCEPTAKHPKEHGHGVVPELDNPRFLQEEEEHIGGRCACRGHEVVRGQVVRREKSVRCSERVDDYANAPAKRDEDDKLRKIESELGVRKLPSCGGRPLRIDGNVLGAPKAASSSGGSSAHTRRPRLRRRLRRTGRLRRCLRRCLCRCRCICPCLLSERTSLIPLFERCDRRLHGGHGDDGRRDVQLEHEGNRTDDPREDVDEGRRHPDQHILLAEATLRSCPWATCLSWAHLQ